MKRVLITGAGSYIGTSLKNWLENWYEQYIIDVLDMKDSNWKNYNFSQYDAVFHVAGIAHVDYKKMSSELQKSYYSVNRDLTIETASIAKLSGVKQFIFMSSIIVYGTNKSLHENKIINKHTKPAPSNIYGDSKLQAEEGILSLHSEDFKVVILRPPMIYGKGAKGNYPKLSKLARTCPIFPYIANQRSMLHIDHLCEFIRYMVEYEEYGIFYPQNEEYTCTSELVKLISEIHNKRLKLTKIFNPLISILPVNIFNKVFGTVIYEKEMSKYQRNYNIHDFKETIILTEKE